MTEPVAEPVAPAKPYTVTDVAGHVPVVLDDFVGATTVLVAADDREYRLRGAGKRDGQAVEFHEKEPASAADDAPVWRIIERGEGDIVAEPPRVEPDSHAARGRNRLPERQECVGVVMDAREELTSILRVAAEAAIAGGHPVLTYEGYADAAVLAGWRPPPTVITDPAGLAEVPDGTVVLDALGVPRQLAGRLWVGTSDGSLPAQQVPLPGTVLHIPLRGAMAP